MNNKTKYILRILVGAVMISFSGVWVALANVEPSTSAFYRVLFGAAFLFVLAAWRRELRQRKKYYLPLGFICGAAFALDLFFYHHGIILIGPGLATICANFQVFILGGVGVLFLGEPIRFKLFLAIPVAFLGLFLVVGIKWEQLAQIYKAGVYFSFAAAICYSAFILLLRKLQGAQEDTSIIYPLMLISLTTAIFLGGQMLAWGTSFRIPDLKSAAALVVLGLFSQATAWLLIANTLPKIRASLAGLVLLLQPALAFVWDVLFFARPTTLLNWFGVAVTLTGIYLGLTAEKEKKARNSK